MRDRLIRTTQEGQVDLRLGLGLRRDGALEIEQSVNDISS